MTIIIPMIFDTKVDALSVISGFIFLTTSSKTTAAIEFRPEDAELTRIKIISKK